MRDFLPQIKQSLGVYQRVHVIDGTYHRHGSNINEPDRNGRSHVVGTTMRCGLAQVFPDPWSWPTLAVSVDIAHEQAEPCPRCFDLTYAIEPDGQAVMAW